MNEDALEERGVGWLVQVAVVVQMGRRPYKLRMAANSFNFFAPKSAVYFSFIPSLLLCRTPFGEPPSRASNLIVKGFAIHTMSSTSRPPRPPAPTPPPPSVHPAASQPPPTNELDTIVNLESTFHSEGAASAYASGASLGHTAGRSMGWRAGVALTSELEFYRGAATALVALHDSFPELVPAKAEAAAKRLLEQTGQVALAKLGNDKNVDMDTHKEAIRRFFRQMTAFAGLPGVRFDLVGSKIADLDF